MSILRRSKKKPPPRPAEAPETPDLYAILQGRVEQLEREHETNIKRMAAMQAEIDHLRALISRTP